MLSLREVRLFNHKRADFWLPNFGFKRSLLSLLKKFFSYIVINLNTANYVNSKSYSEILNEAAMLVQCSMDVYANTSMNFQPCRNKLSDALWDHLQHDIRSINDCFESVRLNDWYHCRAGISKMVYSITYTRLHYVPTELDIQVLY